MILINILYNAITFCYGALLKIYPGQANEALFPAFAVKL